MSPWVALSRAATSSAIVWPVTVSQSKAVVITNESPARVRAHKQKRLFNRKAEEALGLSSYCACVRRWQPPLQSQTGTTTNSWRKPGTRTG